MLLVYGPTGFPVALGDVSWSKGRWGYELARNAAGIGYGLLGSADFSEVGFTVAGQANADAKAAAVTAALAVQGGDLSLLRDDGTGSFKTVLSSQTLSGVRCVRGPVWSDKPGAQHLTWLEFAATFEWETAFPSGVALLEYEETVEVDGGTPLYVAQEYLNAAPDLFQVVYQQKYTVRQYGYAVGRTGWPAVGSAVGVPQFANPQRRPARYTSPTRVGDGYRGYRAEWSYQWEFAAVPAYSTPALWTG